MSRGLVVGGACGFECAIGDFLGRDGMGGYAGVDYAMDGLMGGLVAMKWGWVMVMIHANEFPLNCFGLILMMTGVVGGVGSVCMDDAFSHYFAFGRTLFGRDLILVGYPYEKLLVNWFLDQGIGRI